MGFTSQNLKEVLLVGITKPPLISNQNLYSKSRGGQKRKKYWHSFELFRMDFTFYGIKFSLSSYINKSKSQYFLVTSSFTPE